VRLRWPLLSALSCGAGGQRDSSELVARPRIPRSIEEVDNGQILGFSAELAEDHPGFGDPAYIQRRGYICNLARTHIV
jgi:hypothetical protein